MSNFLYIALFLVPALLAFRRGFQAGLCCSLALFAFVSNGLTLEGVGGGFELTFQRILLVIVMVRWFGWVKSRPPGTKIPFLGLFLAWWGANLLSLVFAKDFSLSLKYFVSFSTEIMLFYFIVSTSLADPGSIMGAFNALCVSTTIIAALGVIEYYYGFNPFLDWMKLHVAKDENDVVVGFKHRILFGYSMAMGWPLLLAAAHAVKGRMKILMMTAAVMMTIACCYYSNSRGPWFAAAIGGVIMAVMGSAKVRKTLTIFACLSVVVVIARPGVRDTLADLTLSTFDPTSYRGQSYYYRKELWPVAISLAKESPIRALFGYGGQATETMDLSDRFKYGGSSAHLGYSSWDNNYAADFVEFGFVGLAIQLVLYGCVLRELVRYALRAPPELRDKSAAITAAVVTYVFALTNVYMFSPQLKCMLLTIVVIGIRLPMLAPKEQSGAVAQVPDPLPEAAIEANPA